jgi:RNA polymerase sigma-70 factor (ECF subfamily)
MEEGIQDSHLCDWMDLIEQLVEPYRSVFMKKALGDCSYSSLAYEYGKSENWLRVTFYRARVQLQKMLNEKGDE